jgi:hypothetical protein
MKVIDYYDGWIADYICKHCSIVDSRCDDCKVADTIREANEETA